MEKKHFFSYIRLWCMVGGFCFFIPLSALAQSQKISVKMRDVSLEKAMQIIGKQSSMDVAYSKEFVDPNLKVSLNVRNKALEKVLQDLFRNTNVGFRFRKVVFYFLTRWYKRVD